MAFSFDAAAVTDGLGTETAVDASGFGFGLEICPPPGEEREAVGVSNGVMVSFTTPVL